MTSGAPGLDLQLLRASALLETDPLAAARTAEEILRSCAGHPAARLLLGSARRAAGDLAGAEAVLASLVAERPTDAIVRLELARTLIARGRDADAVGALEQVVALEPKLADAWRDLSRVYAAAGEPLQCDRAYARFAALGAELPATLQEAGAALAQRRFAAAEALLKRHLARSPGDSAALRLLGEIAYERGEFAHSEALLRECLRVEPGFSRARLDLVALLLVQQKPEPMLPLLERLLALEPANPLYRSHLAGAHTLLGHLEQASEILTALLAESPGDARVWLSYGHNLRGFGHQEEAVTAYRRSITLEPGFGEAYFSLANLKTFRFRDEEMAAMRAQLARAELPDRERLQFEFALGQALEDRGEFADSFAHYARGNALRRAVIDYDGARRAGLVRRSCALYTREFFGARAGFGAQAPDPIFIVGLPRSGSTLLEQILASHSQVEGTRELADITGFAIELGAFAPSDAYPHSVAQVSRAQALALGERYLAQTRPQRHLGRPYFIDKMPENLLHLGLMHLILPNARIIDARRGALACCFSNFKQHYQEGAWFSYSLEDLGHYYRDYVRLMEHFDQVLPGRVHRVRYERLVADLEGEVRSLLAYCGLPFEDACLRFHETKRIVQTASSEQVRRPLYAHGLEQWRNFEPWLGPLKEALGALAAEDGPAP